MMNFRLTPRALLEAKRKKTWWHENRPEAPDLFDEEMRAVIEQIRSSPTENHLFYAVRGGEIVVLSIWGARKKRGPKL